MNTSNQTEQSFTELLEETFGVEGTKEIHEYYEAKEPGCTQENFWKAGTKPETLDGPAVCASRKAHLERLMALQEPMERIVSRLPADFDGRISAREDDTIQICRISREQALETMRILSAGKWDRAVCSNDATRIDYETTIEGVRVLLYCIEPPESCRIETEEIPVPATTITKRTIVCGGAK